MMHIGVRAVLLDCRGENTKTYWGLLVRGVRLCYDTIDHSG